MSSTIPAPMVVSYRIEAPAAADPARPQTSSQVLREGPYREGFDFFQGIYYAVVFCLVSCGTAAALVTLAVDSV